MPRSIGLGNFPVGNIVPLKSEMSYFQLGNSEILRAPRLDSEIRVGKYEFPSPMGRSISHVKTFVSILQLLSTLIYSVTDYR